ncbi:YeeE/YedE family protein [Colletotrichum graminicola]|uniref:YeeE/YedE family protein n=1 Tax=Colletotrichum graminicola (strain M1.001 / M2 / FGSC 10212) TaxID=645133 RepID=E3Q9S8_COLGM|nr:YeeE/YedE family protein [Colletotrichum graminicola M1.001]EFQ27616.1 YeeE/YedE family protein [Colletotrichum graminicola M1.001]WDK11740.1 YeeE/YedE family protein [Colletotrichum graminicola]
MATTVLSGAAFGASLVAAGVYQPSVIIAQLKFEDWHMIQAFVTAMASSTFIVYTLDSVGYVRPNPRSPSRLGLFSQYDGNILGGAILGAGMALSGSCPGTVLAQIAVGTRSGIYVLAGAALAGIAWTGSLQRLITSNACAAGPEGPRLTVHERVGVSRAAAFVGLEALYAGVMYACLTYAPASPRAVVVPVVGGALIGLAQLFSLLARKSMLGVSTSYDEIGKYFWWAVRGGGEKGKPASYSNILFSASLVAGAWVLAQAYPKLVSDAAESVVSPSLAAAGGFLIGLGSRIAGGCTSGHGLSGVAVFSTASFVTIMSMFGAGALVAPFFYQ